MSSSNNTSHTRRFRQRASDGLVRLESPWGWLGVRDAMKLAAEAYRVASYMSRHVQDADVVEAPGFSFESVSSEGETMQEMREAFTECLADVFRSLLDGRAVEQGVCWPDESNYVQAAARFRDSVPADWRPQYPQFGKAEPGKVQGFGGGDL